MVGSVLLRDIGRMVAERGREAYFVGGCVRDALRGEPIKDVDFAVAGDPYAAGRAVANAYDGHLFWLRQDEGVARVLLPSHEGLQVDFTPLRGTLEEDLRARDLTINAMAIPAETGLEPGERLVDLFEGRADLAARRIRFVTAAAPEHDPLRTLRALRFRWKLGFELEPETAERVRQCVPLLGRVSTERIRDELFQLLPIGCAAEALAECLECGMAPWLFGSEVGLVRDQGLSGPAAALRRMLGVLQSAPPDLESLLSQEPTPPRRRREVLLWAAAIQPLGASVDPAAAARRLALSNVEGQIIVKGLANAGTARELAERWPVRGRMLYRLSRQAAPAGPEAVLLAAASHGWSGPYAEMLDDQLRRCFWPEEPLVTGLEVMQLLGIAPGPRVGQVLEEVQEARADGLLRTHEDAVRWLRERARPD